MHFQGFSLLGDIFSYMQPGYLVAAIEFTSVSVALVVLLIYSKLYFRKRAHLYHSAVRNKLENRISEMLVSDQEDNQIPPDLQDIVRTPAGRQLATAELVNCRNNFTGAVAETVVRLYELLGLKKHSLERLASTQWHIKAGGIRELYLMDQTDTLKKIYRYTNNSNELVRMEAQIGILHMSGFDGLRFLDVVSYPITEWQQIKLLEQLKHSPKSDKLAAAVPKWLDSPNATITRFALKLADEYQLYSLRTEVSGCLEHKEAAVRKQAVHTLVKIADEQTSALLISLFPRETRDNQLAILQELEKIAAEELSPFLLSVLEEKDNGIKLAAAKVLASMNGPGMDALAEKGRLQPVPYEEIYQHVKSAYRL